MSQRMGARRRSELNAARSSRSSTQRAREISCNCSLAVFCNWHEKAGFPHIPSAMDREKYGGFVSPSCLPQCYTLASGLTCRRKSAGTETSTRLAQERALYFRTLRESDGKRVENKLPIGLVSEFPTKASAWREVELSIFISTKWTLGDG